MNVKAEPVHPIHNLKAGIICKGFIFKSPKSHAFLGAKRKSLMMQIKLYCMTEVMKLSACCITAMP
jgi:hypothetical protein